MLGSVMYDHGTLVIGCWGMERVLTMHIADPGLIAATPKVPSVLPDMIPKQRTRRKL